MKGRTFRGDEITTAEAARLCHVSSRTVQRWITSGSRGRDKLPAEETAGGHARISLHELQDWALRNGIRCDE
jgi:excisionase family DNA binding protein